MSTQPEAGNDLDRTDELPVLDVAAYEATQPEDDADPLARTDAWAVEASQSQTASDDEAIARNTPAPSLRSLKATSRGPDVSLDVDRVLNRIAELEAGISTARAAQAEAESRCQSLVLERDTFEQRLAAVEASNARLGEHSTISQELAQRLEQQLREQSGHHRERLAEIEAAREADQLAARQDRAVLERQIEQAAANLSGTADKHAQLKAALDEALALAATRAERVDELQQTLAEEESAAYGLGRNLAAKLAEHDILTSMVAQRNATIAALEHERDDLGLQLQQSTAKANAEVERLMQELQATDAQRDELAAASERLAAKDAELASVSTQLAAAQGDHAALRSELETQSNLVQARQEELAAARQLAATLQGTHDELQQALEESKQQALQLEVALKDNGELLNARNAEFDIVCVELNQQIAATRELQQSLQERDTLLETLRGEMHMVQDERTILANELNKARSRMKSMAQQVLDADNRIAALKADLAVHTEALAAIRRDVEQHGDRPDAPSSNHDEHLLEPLNHESEPILLNRKVMTLGRTDDNDICIASKLISRHHARLLVGPNAVIVEDAGSTNGCYVNGREVRRQILRENDVLMLGDMKFRLRVRPPDGVTRVRSNVIDFNKPA